MASFLKESRQEESHRGSVLLGSLVDEPGTERSWEKPMTLGDSFQRRDNFAQCIFKTWTH